LGSKKILEEKLEVPIYFFCYPGGSYDQKVKKATQQAGFKMVLTTKVGVEIPADNLLEIPRIRVSGEASLEEFISRLK